MDYYLDAFVEFEEESGPQEYEVVRALLRPEFRDLSDWELENRLAEVLSRLSPLEVEGFWDTVRRGLGTVGRVAQQVAPAVLPMAGTALGTLVGGPAGAALGGTLGRLGAQALGGTRPAAAAPPSPTPAAAPPGATPGAAGGPVAAPLPVGATSATAQLLRLIQNPALLQALLGQLLGPLGQGTTPVGRESVPVPFGAFMNTLSSLANLAAAEAQKGTAVESLEYLQDSQGNFLVDPANPEARAARLLELLQESTYDEQESLDPLTEWLAAAGLLK